MNHKNVLITGGRSNLGQSIRKAFGKQGYEVWYTVSSPEKADSDHAIPIDLSKTTGIREALGGLIRLDVLVNNAGVFTEGQQEDLPLDKFGQVFDLNVRGLFLITQALLPLLKENDGSIVNISSMDALHPGFGTTAHYDASKGAVSAYTRSLAAETGLRVNAAAPGLINVEHLVGSDLDLSFRKHSVFPQMVSPEAVADTVLFLAESRGIYGQTILIDNGYCLR